MKARYDIERAKLDVNKGDTVSRIENEQAKLTLADARAAAARARGEGQIRPDAAPRPMSRQAPAKAREGACSTCERAERGPAEPRAASARGRYGQRPAELPRPASPFGGQQEFQEGDRAWPGAAILELPDLSSVHLEARLDEADRGRLQAGSRKPPCASRPSPARISRRASTDISVLAQAWTSPPAGRRRGTSI